MADAEMPLTAHLEELPDGHGKGDVDRILTHHGGEGRAARAHEIADRDTGTSDPTPDRALDVGVGEVELGLL